MQEYELPEVYRNDDQFTHEAVELVMGRGQRSRTDVRYDDGLTEEQWLNVCMGEYSMFNHLIEWFKLCMPVTDTF